MYLVLAIIWLKNCLLGVKTTITRSLTLIIFYFIGYDCFFFIISLKVSEQTSETSQLSEKWFHHLDPNMLNIVVGIAKQPFPELRLSSHSVLKVLSALPWGQKKMSEFPGFNEYLLDRSTEKTKEGKESKFQIVKSLAESPTTLNIFGQPYYVKLKAYFLQGPLYVQTETQVAYEGE